jgi:hypothetical protein
VRSEIILSPREDVRIQGAQAKGNVAPGAEDRRIAADETRAQRQALRLADHQDGVSIVDDVIDDQIDGIIGAGGFGRPMLSFWTAA